jgi:hypothetical protein
MTKITAFCTATLAVVLSACSTVPGTLRAGTGVVEYVRAMGSPVAEPMSTYSQSSIHDPRATAGRLPDRSGMVGDEGQLSLRMDDGTRQVLANGNNQGFRAGDRVQVTPEGKVIRL